MFLLNEKYLKNVFCGLNIVGIYIDNFRKLQKSDLKSRNFAILNQQNRYLIGKYQLVLLNCSI